MTNENALDQRAVIYVRVSTKEQELYSLESQLEKCRAYAETKGLTIVHEPFKEARSGWKADARVEFYKMLEYIEREKIPGVVFAWRSRMQRNPEDYVRLKAAGIILHDVEGKQSFDPNNPDDYEATASYEVEVANSRKSSSRTSTLVRDGYNTIVKQGKFPHALPLGYNSFRISKKVRRLEIDPVRGPMIQTLFRLFATGTYTRKQIATKMRDLGLRSRKGNPISRSQIEHYLKDIKYCGQQFRWKGGEAQDWHETCPPLISQALFNEVQAVFEAKRTVHRRGPDYKYRGTFTCGICGCAYIQEDKVRHYYRCTYQRKPCNTLGSPRLKESELDLLLETEIGMLDFEPSVYDWLKGEVEETFQLNRKTEAVERARLEAELKSIVEERARTLQAFTKGITADEGLVREEINRLSERKAAIDRRLKELDTGEELIIRNSLDTLGILKDFKNQYLSADPEKRRRMNFLLFRKIAVQPLKCPKKELLADPKRALLLGEYPLEIEWKEPFDWLFEGKFIRELGRLADAAMTEDQILHWMKKPAYPAENEIERA